MNIILLCVTGLIIGTFVILLGGGGAAIYLGILTGIFGLPASAAASTSLVTVLPSLIAGVWAYHRQGQINTKLGNQMLITAIPAVIVGSLCSHFIPGGVYKWLIGIILVILGINMLFQTNKTTKSADHPASDDHARLKAGIYGVIGGLMVGVAGMSGGAVIVAGLFLLGLKAFNATATSTYVLLFMTAIGTIFHVTGGQVDWHAGIPLMAGALVGALIAPLLASHMAKTKLTGYMKPAIGIFLVLLGIKSLF